MKAAIFPFIITDVASFIVPPAISIIISTIQSQKCEEERERQTYNTVDGYTVLISIYFLNNSWTNNRYIHSAWIHDSSS